MASRRTRCPISSRSACRCTNRCTGGARSRARPRPRSPRRCGPALRRRGVTAIPREVDRVVARGLAAAAAQRHPSMDALLGALARAAARRPVKPVLAAGAIGVVLATTATVAIVGTHRRDAARGGRERRDRAGERSLDARRAPVKARERPTRNTGATSTGGTPRDRHGAPMRGRRPHAPTRSRGRDVIRRSTRGCCSISPTALTPTATALRV